MIWVALCPKEFTKALTVAEDNLWIETDRAHAFLFIGHVEEAKAFYLGHKGKPLSEADSKLWERVIVEDFAQLRSKAGLTHPMMADIEKELGVSPDGNSGIGQR